MCLELEKHEQFRNVFSTKLEESEITLREALEKTTGIECSVDDELPPQICQGCQLRLQDAHSFMVQGCANNDLLESLKIAAATIRSAAEDESYELPSPITVEPVDEGVGVTVTFDKGESFRVEYLDDDESSLQEVAEDDSVAGDDLENESEGDQEEDSDASQIVFEEPADAVDFILQNFKDRSKGSPKAKKSSIVTQRHECEVCQKTFQRKSNLVDHLRLHANVKLFSCSYCDAAFVQSGNLKSHIRTHTQEKPFTCSVCQKGFSQSSALKTHMRSHTNERDYICDVCQKGFTNKSDLTKHKITHTDLRYYQCVRCTGRLFAQKIHLKKHLMAHHPDENVPNLLKLGTLKDGIHLSDLKPPIRGSILIRKKYTPNVE